MTGSLDVVEAHALRARPTASRNNPNLSDYACTCGEEFISSDLAPSTPYGTPSLARAPTASSSSRKRPGSAPSRSSWNGHGWLPSRRRRS